jgi:uncharacterized protein DUF5343
MMTEETKQIIPPYLPFSALESFIAEMKEHGLPQVIDRSLLQGRSGSIQAWLLSSLRFFRFIDESGEPTRLFHRIVESTDGETVQAEWKGLVHQGYPEFFEDGFDFARATADQIAGVFRGRGAKGTTVDKCMKFLQGMCERAGIEVSPHLGRARRSGVTNGHGGRKRRPRKAPVAKTPTPPETSDVTPALNNNLLKGLIEKLPAAGAVWPEQKREDWFNLAKAIFTMTYKENAPPEIDE